MEILKIYKGPKMTMKFKQENDVRKIYEYWKKFYEKYKIDIKAGECVYVENDGQHYKGYYIELI